MRNLLRLRVAGLPVPKPHYLRRNVLMMDFIGKDGWHIASVSYMSRFVLMLCLV